MTFCAASTTSQSRASTTSPSSRYNKHMKLHIITVGEQHLAYARQGWDEYLKRLGHYHQLQITHVPDKKAYDAEHILQTAGNAYKIALVIDGQQFTSPELAAWLEKRAPEGRTLCFLIGGPE